jgi:hypothetical protein
VRGDPKAVLLVEWSGTREHLDERFSKLDDLAREVGSSVAVPLRSAAEMALTVRLRKSTLPLLLGTTDKEKPVAFVEDARYPQTGWRSSSGASRRSSTATAPGPASTGTRASVACTSVPPWTPRIPKASPGCAGSGRRSRTW